ncbi:MAG TPA: hypothetical protein PLW83_00140 [Deltaproteobacteria bacterium]|nr:hypothetical protein [Deltaproteobacteria bacterium]
MLETISGLDALKWAVLAFLAGFIGFYGKFLGRLVLDMLARAKGTAPAQAPPDKHEDTTPAPGREGATHSPAGEDMETGSTGGVSDKVLKKAIKAKIKAEKKQGKA